MISLKLYRLNNTSRGCQGVMLVNDIARFTTLERPWLDNHKGISCIPAGKYSCEWAQTSTSGSLNGMTIGVMNVKNRENIRIHAGNKMEDSEGCILLGTDYEDGAMATNLKVWIGRSASAMYRFLSMLKEEKEIELEVINLFKEGV